MLGIQPEGVEFSVLTNDLDQLGAEKLAQGEHPYLLTGGEHLLDSRHRVLPSGWSNPQNERLR
jgi:hypothetical protein